MPGHSRKLALIFITLAAITLGSTGAVYWMAQRVAEANVEVAQSREIILGLEQMLSTLRDAETGQRGFLLTGSEKYLEPYEAAVQRVGQDLDQLRHWARTQDVSPAQADLVARLTRQKLDELSKTIRLRREKGLDVAMAVVRSDAGKRIMDELRDRIGSMQAEEHQELSAWHERRDRATRLRTAAAIAMALVDLMFLAWAFRRIASAIASVQRSSEQIAQQKDLLAVTLASIGDAVLVTDPLGHVTFMNGEAERLTGWTNGEAAGQPLSAVFNIINEKSRGPVESPADKVLRLGTVVGLANHTILISKDGRETPIDDSGAPIRGADGTVRGVVLVFRDFSEQKKAEAALRQSEERVRRKLESVLSPEGDIGDLELTDIIDAPAIQSLMDEFHKMVQLPMAIIDLKGKVLVGVGWQEICTKFHRVHPEACRHCTESDTQLSAGVAPGEFRLYRCKNNMWDVATPILLAGQHIGNLFTGQFFFEGETPDRELFRAQARQYGFPEEEYLAKLDDVPRLSREKVQSAMGFFIRLADMLSLLSHSNVKLARSLTELTRREAQLHQLNRTLKAFSDSKQALIHSTGEAALLRQICEIVAEDCGHKMVWIGYANEGEAKTVRPVAYAGFEEGYLETLKITWADAPRGRGPTGTAIRTGKPCGCLDILTDPALEPWRAEAVRRGYASSLALPLMAGGRAFGALTIYSPVANAFSQDEVELLARLASDLAYGIGAIRMREAHARGQESLRRSEEQLRLATQAAQIGVWSWVPGTSHVAVSANWRRLFGAEPDAKVTFETWRDALHPEDRDRAVRELNAASEQGGEFNTEYRVLRADGAVRWVVDRGRAWYDESGKPVGMAGVNVDITERKAAEEALAAAKISAEQAKAAAEEANKAKDHFLAVLSHELRTPLTPVLATVSMLQEERQLDEDTREGLEIVRRNVEMEARLIDDLLDVTRIARGKVELDKRPVQLREVIQRAAEVCQPDIEARQLQFRVDLDSGEPCQVEADAARLQQVFWNLLKNAIKFTPHGGHLSIRCRRNAHDAIVEVNDSGVGIEPEALTRIFNAFEQAERSTTRQFGGLGLGLTISKALVEMHGGTIEAFSEGKGKGATFRVRLPAASSQLPVGEAPSPLLETGPKLETRSLRVLLVEDHGDTARIMTRMLTRKGYEVQTAGDVASALELAGQSPFDLLISDLGLPDRSGMELIRELRASGYALPAIALSGYGQEEDIKRSHEAGFNAHLTKPVDVEQFCRAISAVAGSAPQGSSLGPPAGEDFAGACPQG